MPLPHITGRIARTILPCGAGGGRGEREEHPANLSMEVLVGKDSSSISNFLSTVYNNVSYW